jgi:hypothetical protein
MTINFGPGRCPQCDVHRGEPHVPGCYIAERDARRAAEDARLAAAWLARWRRPDERPLPEWDLDEDERRFEERREEKLFRGR